MFKALIMKTHSKKEQEDRSFCNADGNEDGNADVQGTAGLDQVLTIEGKKHKYGWKMIPVYLAAAIFGIFLLVTIRLISTCLPEIRGGTLPSSFTFSLKDLWGFVLIFAVACLFVLRVSKSFSRKYSNGEKMREMILFGSLLILVTFVNPVISQPLDKFQLFTASTVLLTGVLILFWVIVLILAGIYQMEYKAIFGTYFHGRDFK